MNSFFKNFGKKYFEKTSWVFAVVVSRLAIVHYLNKKNLSYFILHLLMVLIFLSSLHIDIVER